MGTCSWLFFKTPPQEYRQIRHTRMKWKIGLRERVEIIGHNHEFLYRTPLSLCLQNGIVQEHCDIDVAHHWFLYLFQCGDFSLYCISTNSVVEGQPNKKVGSGSSNKTSFFRITFFQKETEIKSANKRFYIRWFYISEGQVERLLSDSFRLLCEHGTKLVSVAQPCMLKSCQELITSFFHHTVQVITWGKTLNNLEKDSVNITDGMQTHPHKPYLDYVSDLFCDMESLSEQERIEVYYRDILHTPLQPLKNNLEAIPYEMIEKDSVKYIQYQRAIAKALKDMVSNEKASELTTILMVVGAERGFLVTASLQGAEETGRKLNVWISKPLLYSSFIQPITTSKLYNDVKARNDLPQFPNANSVKLHSVARLAPSQSVSTFTRPNLSRKPNNQCYKKLCFNLPSDMGSALVHAVLYDDVHLSIEPTTATPNLIGWMESL